MAERAGFEPAVGVTLRRFSKPLPSATRPPLRVECFNGFSYLLINSVDNLMSRLRLGCGFRSFGIIQATNKVPMIAFK